MEVPALELNTGACMPALGFGSGTLGSTQELKAAVHCAIQLGYRHFDTAGGYGTESAIGEGLAEAFKAGVIRRDEIFVTSKLPSDELDPQDVTPALEKSLRSLQLEYLDLYLIHAPVKLQKGAKFPPKEEDILPDGKLSSTWEALESCVQKGLAKAIGVSNFTVKKLQSLLCDAKLIPAVNQVELHPVWQQRQLREYCTKAGIQVAAWSPLGGLGKPWGSNSVLEHPIIRGIAENHGKTPAQVIIRWITEIGVGAIVKSYNSGRLAENIKSFEFQLFKEDHDRLETIDQMRLARWEFLCNSTTSPYKSVEDLWDGEL